MIKVTYHSEGYATMQVSYPANHSMCMVRGNADDWFLAFRNGAVVANQHFGNAEYSMSRRTHLFDVDTVYDPDIDSDYFARTPEAECALEIARASLS